MTAAHDDATPIPADADSTVEGNGERPPRAGVAWLISTVAACILYLLTMAPGLVWGDSGNAQVRILLGHVYDRVDLSRSHVLYYAVADAVVSLGVSPALAGNLVSALAGAVTVGNTAWLLTLLVRRRAAIVSGVCLLLLSHCLWHLSTVAEVMSFSTALLSLELVLAVKFIGTRRPKWLIAALFVNGLGLSTHNMSLLMWPAYGVLVAFAFISRKPVSWRTLAFGVAMLGVGALPVIALFVVAARASGDPLGTLREMLSGRYGRHVYNVDVDWGLVLKTMAYTAYSFPTPLVAACVAGVGVLWTRRARALVSFILIAFVVHCGFALRYNVPDQHVFMLHSYIFLIVFLAIGVDWLCDRTPSRFRSVIVIALALPAPLVYWIVPDLLQQRFPEIAARCLPDRVLPYRDNATWFLRPWRHGYDGPLRFAREVLASVPEDGILTIDSTPMTPLLYVQNADGLRRDVRILAGYVFQPWFEDAIDMASPQRDEIVSQGRLYATTQDRRSWNDHLRGGGYRGVPHGKLFRIEHSNADAPENR